MANTKSTCLLVKSSIITLSLMATACATTPDPAVVCSADWIKPRAQSAMKEIKRETGRTISSLSKSAAKMAAGDKLSAFQTYSMIKSVTSLTSKFEKSQGLKDLKTLSSTCNDPQLVKDSFMGLLAEYDAPQALIDMFDGFERLYNTQSPAQNLPET